MGYSFLHFAESCDFFDGVVIGNSPIHYFCFGVLEFLFWIVLLLLITKSNYLEQLNFKIASNMAVLPIYHLVLWYMLIVGAFVWIVNIGGIYPSDMYIIGLKWFLYRGCTEGLAVSLMMNGVGERALFYSLLAGFIWGSLSSVVPLIIFAKVGYQPYYDALVVLGVILFLFYAVNWLAPMYWIHRRPALIRYSRFYTCLLLFYIAVVLLVRVSGEQWWACSSVIILLLLDLIQPFVVFRALQEDSLFWQGLYSADEEFVNAPLMGIWDLGRETIGELAMSISILEHQVVTVIPFGAVRLDTSSYIAGGTARVYFGSYKTHKVAVKILFCVEISPERIVAFRSEASLLYSLSHANIVKCYGVSIMPPALCLVTEYCRFGSLYDFLHSTKYQWDFLRGTIQKRFNTAEETGNTAETVLKPSFMTYLKRVWTNSLFNNDTLYTPLLRESSNNSDMLSQVRRISKKRTNTRSYHFKNFNCSYEQHLRKRKHLSAATDAVPDASTDSRDDSRLLSDNPSETSGVFRLHALQDALRGYYATDLSFSSEKDKDLEISGERLKSGVSLIKSPNILLDIANHQIRRSVDTPVRTLFKSANTDADFMSMGSQIEGDVERGSIVNKDKQDGAQPTVADLLPTSLRLQMASDCCAGLSFLHSKGIMHCDVKSLNFLVTDGLVVKLADLGESRPITAVASSSPVSKLDIPQNINWSAPEVLCKNVQAINDKADVWSLAMVIFEILTGEVPFDGQNYSEKQVEPSEFDIYGVPSPLKQFLIELKGGMRPNISSYIEVVTKNEPESDIKWLHDLMNSAWEFDPSKRIPSVELLSVLLRETKEH